MVEVCEGAPVTDIYWHQSSVQEDKVLLYFPWKLTLQKYFTVRNPECGLSNTAEREPVRTKGKRIKGTVKGQQQREGEHTPLAPIEFCRIPVARQPSGCALPLLLFAA